MIARDGFLIADDYARQGPARLRKKLSELQELVRAAYVRRQVLGFTTDQPAYK